MSRLPPDDFFAPVVRPWVEPEKPKVRRRRMQTDEHAVFNPVLRVLPELAKTILREDDIRTSDLMEPLSQRFARVSVPPAKAPKKQPGPTGEKWEWFVDDAKKRIEQEEKSGNTLGWKDAKPFTFVALYTLMHVQLYGVEVTMGSSDRSAAASMVKRLLKTNFSEDSEKFTWFVSWVWSDEAKRWNASKQSKRMSWRWCFTNEKFDDWQASMRKQRERKKDRELVDVGIVRG